MRRALLYLILVCAASAAAAEVPPFRALVGEMVEGVACASDPSQTYTLYLPPGFTNERRWPVLLVFDPRGRSLLAAELFREAAETYGWIIVSSDNTRSDGPLEPNLVAIQALWPEVHSRLPADFDRIYAAGFSGGVAVATLLARDMGVSVEFVPFRKKELADGLDKGYFDIAVSGLAVNIEDMQKVIYSIPVMELNRSLVVADHRVKEFSSVENLHAHPAFTLAYVEYDDVIKKARPDFPNVTFKEIDDYKAYFTQTPGTYDSLLISAQAGSAWTLFFPHYGVTAINRRFSYPTAYAIAQDNPRLLRFVDNWLELQQVSGEQQRIYDYWILGRGAVQKTARWSVIRDVLGWVD